ncbi:MAG TPA: NAD(P)-dependent oxidoreductase [Burkholderiaceae bacterium]
MKILVTGSSGHLGEALVRTLREAQHDVVGIDIVASPFTDHVGSIADRGFVRACIAGGIEAVLHAATLHKPHVATHPRQAFVDVNITGTLNLLEEAVAARHVGAFVFTSTTSAFGAALSPPPGAPAAWITEDVAAVPKNIYGATKTAAEDLCQLFHRDHGLACLVLRTSRFFPEGDDDDARRAAYADANLKANEFLYRRVELEDVVGAHLQALARAPDLGFGKFIISATTPFVPADLAELRHDAAAVLKRRVPGVEAVYAARGWKLPAEIDRVYVNARARTLLGWQPRHDFARVLRSVQDGEDFRSPLARTVGAKGYHPELT